MVFSCLRFGLTPWILPSLFGEASMVVQEGPIPQAIAIEPIATSTQEGIERR
jgi:hypothetical protein